MGILACDGFFAQCISYNRRDISTNGYATTVLIADFNQDGKLDIAYVSDGVVVLLGRGNGIFLPEQDTPIGSSANLVVAVGDLNGAGALGVTVHWQLLSDVTMVNAPKPPLMGNEAVKGSSAYVHAP